MKITHTKTNVVQCNDYYPFGLTSTSWTRTNTKNNFLYNEGSELNNTSGWYETMFRGYDPALGRFMQVDPLAHVDHSTSSFAYAGNNPVMYNDPQGLLKTLNEVIDKINDLWSSVPESGGEASWSDDGGGGGGGEGETSWTVFLADSGNGGGGLNITFTKTSDGLIKSSVSVAGSSREIFDLKITDTAEVEGAHTRRGRYII